VKKKLMIIVPVLVLLIAGAGYKMVLAPKPKPVKKKIDGHLVKLDPEFVLNLSGGRYAKVTVSVLTHTLPAAGHGTGPIVLEQNDAIRAVITDVLTGVSAHALINRRERKHLVEKIVKSLHKKTDEHVEEVFFTDLAVQ
jgi:flagellar basal body-associated protein FliL